MSKKAKNKLPYQLKESTKLYIGFEYGGGVCFPTALHHIMVGSGWKPLEAKQHIVSVLKMDTKEQIRPETGLTWPALESAGWKFESYLDFSGDRKYASQGFSAAGIRIPAPVTMYEPLSTEVECEDRFNLLRDAGVLFDTVSSPYHREAKTIVQTANDFIAGRAKFGLVGLYDISDDEAHVVAMKTGNTPTVYDYIPSEIGKASTYCETIIAATPPVM